MGAKRRTECKMQSVHVRLTLVWRRRSGGGASSAAAVGKACTFHCCAATAAGRALKHPSRANLGGSGGPAAREGEGSQRCRWAAKQAARQQAAAAEPGAGGG